MGLYHRVLMVIGGHRIDEFNQLTREVEERLLRVLDLWQTREYTHLLLCGGITMPWKVQTKSEAEIMSEWLSNKGVADASMILEDDSTSMLESIECAFQLLRERFMRPLPVTTVVLQPYHAVQCQAIALAHGYDNVHCVYVLQETGEVPDPAFT